MKYKEGDEVVIINPKPKSCGARCYNNGKNDECPYYQQIRKIKHYNMEFMPGSIWVVNMKNKNGGCTGCSGFREIDIRKPTKKDYITAEQKLVEEEI